MGGKGGEQRFGVRVERRDGFGMGGGERKENEEGGGGGLVVQERDISRGATTGTKSHSRERIPKPPKLSVYGNSYS